MNIPITPDNLIADARWMAQAYDPAQQLVRFVEMDAEAYRNASFLDDRLFTADTRYGVLDWASIVSAAEQIEREDAAYIFHIGHVGSTLIARMLGEFDNILSIREPRILRDMTALPSADRESRLTVLNKLFSRSFSSDERTLIKVTSFGSVLAERLPSKGASLVALYSIAPRYIECILAGPNSSQEIRMLAPQKRERLSAFGIAANEPLGSASTAQLAAESWACEMITLQAASQERSDADWSWIEFDEALGSLPDVLQRLATKLGQDIDIEEATKVARGDLIRRYSKATEYDYSPDLRRSLLEEARRLEAASISKAMTWLEECAAASPLLKTALDRSE